MYGSVKYHLGNIGGSEANRMEVVLDDISPSSYRVAPWSFPVMNFWIEVTDLSYREGGWHAEEMSEYSTSVGGWLLMRSWTLWLLTCCCQNTRRRRLRQRMSNTSRRRRSASVVDPDSEP